MGGGGDREEVGEGTGGLLGAPKFNPPSRGRPAPPSGGGGDGSGGVGKGGGGGEGSGLAGVGGGGDAGSGLRLGGEGGGLGHETRRPMLYQPAPFQVSQSSSVFGQPRCSLRSTRAMTPSHLSSLVHTLKPMCQSYAGAQ